MGRAGRKDIEREIDAVIFEWQPLPNIGNSRIQATMRFSSAPSRIFRQVNCQP